MGVDATYAEHLAEQGRGADGLQRPLVPRSRFQPQLTSGVRPHMAAPALSFGKPSAGWLPVRLEIDGQAVEFAASDVGDDPLDQLGNSLLDVAEGSESKTEWFLEPDRYEFNFTPSEGQVVFQVELVEKRTSKLRDLPERRSRKLSWSGPPGALVLSFWRALKKSQSNLAGGGEWLPFPTQIFSKLDQRAREYKNEA